MEAPILRHKVPMNNIRLKSDQQKKVRTFVQWTREKEDVAIAALQKANWNTDLAVDLFYQNPEEFKRNGSKGSDRYKIENMFNIYANDPNDDVAPRRIGPHGLMRLLTDMRLDPLDRKVLILACRLKSQVQCEFSWEEWEKGLQEMRVESVEGLRSKLDAIDAEMNDRTAFRELYNFTFNYGKQAGQRSMELESALSYWRILFKDLFPLLDTWEEFLRTEHGKGISKDTWSLLLDFCFNIKPDLSNYDDDGAWPVLIDQFVDYTRNRMNQTAG